MIRHIVHHARSPWKRAVVSFVIVAIVMLIGTVGLNQLEGVRWLEAFYYMSMIATAQGPVFTPETDAGLIFVSLMAFLSVGVVLVALGFIFGPLFGLLWHVGVDKLDEELRLLKKQK